MATVELKSKILDMLQNANDNVLQDVLVLLEFESNTEEYRLSEPERKSIEIGLEQIENGHTITHEKVVEEISAWLRK